MSPQERRPFDQAAPDVMAAVDRGHYAASFRVPTTCAQCGQDYPCGPPPDPDQKRYDRQQIGLAVTVLVLLIIVPVILAWRVLTG